MGDHQLRPDQYLTCSKHAGITLTKRGSLHPLTSGGSTLGLQRVQGQKRSAATLMGTCVRIGPIARRRTFGSPLHLRVQGRVGRSRVAMELP